MLSSPQPGLTGLALAGASGSPRPKMRVAAVAVGGKGWHVRTELPPAMSTG